MKGMKTGPERRGPDTRIMDSATSCSDGGVAGVGGSVAASLRAESLWLLRKVGGVISTAFRADLCTGAGVVAALI